MAKNQAPPATQAKDIVVDLLVIGSGTGMAAALTANEPRLVHADRGEDAVRWRFDGAVRWSVLDACQPDLGESRCGRHR